jgi:hypothetical protein
MVTILPAENRTRSEEVAKESVAFAREHFDGEGWTDVYVIPEEQYPLIERRIPLAEVHDLVAGRLAPADIVKTGYSSWEQALPDCFAFFSEEASWGAFYGEHVEGIIAYLHLVPCAPENAGAVQLFAEVLAGLGARYSLILGDWWRSVVVDLADRPSIRRYLEEELRDQAAAH